MPGIARATDITSGHGCFPPAEASAASASKDVFIETKGVVREGDGFDPHCCGDDCHDGASDGGSSTVFVNGKKVSRLGDPVKCSTGGGSVIITAAAMTFAGG